MIDKAGISLHWSGVELRKKLRDVRPFWWFVGFFVLINLLWIGPTLMGSGTIREGKKAPAFSLPVIGEQDRVISLEGMKGKAVLLVFWATWCDACVAELPLIEDAAKRWSGRGLAVVGMNVEPESRRMVELFLAQRSVGYPNVSVDQATWNAYKVKVLPAVILVDAGGTVCKAMSGGIGKSRLRRAVESCLPERKKDL